MFFSSHLQSRARTRLRNSSVKEEFDSHPPTFCPDNTRPDMPPSPTPREFRGLASDHNSVIAAQHPRRLGLGTFPATHLSLVAAFVAGHILVVVAFVYAVTTSQTKTERTEQKA